MDNIGMATLLRKLQTLYEILVCFSYIKENFELDWDVLVLTKEHWTFGMSATNCSNLSNHLSRYSCGAKSTSFYDVMDSSVSLELIIYSLRKTTSSMNDDHFDAEKCSLRLFFFSSCLLTTVPINQFRFF